MSELDQHIREALERVVAAAPPPVAAESVGPATPGRPGPAGRRRWLLAVPAAVGALAMAVAVAWLVAPTLGRSGDPAPAGTVEVKAVEPGPVDTDGIDDDRADDDRADDAGGPTTGTFTVPEGRWLSEMVPRIAEDLPGITAAQLWAALESAEPRPPLAPADDAGDASVPGLSGARLQWEGLLFPSTYPVGPGDDAADIVRRMHDELTRVTAELGYERAPEVLGLTPHEVVVVASLVEAEAFNDADRARIARVIHNRLARDLPLSLDTPTIYAAQDRRVDLTPSLLVADGPYSMRVRTGLPPTPIGAPGRASLAAAIEPAVGPWLYYTLADDQGNHAFATTLAEHNANVAAARERGLTD